MMGCFGRPFKETHCTRCLQSKNADFRYRKMLDEKLDWIKERARLKILLREALFCLNNAAAFRFCDNCNEIQKCQKCELATKIREAVGEE